MSISALRGQTPVGPSSPMATTPSESQVSNAPQIPTPEATPNVPALELRVSEPAAVVRRFQRARRASDRLNL